MGKGISLDKIKYFISKYCPEFDEFFKNELEPLSIKERKKIHTELKDCSIENIKNESSRAVQAMVANGSKENILEIKKNTSENNDSNEYINKYILLLSNVSLKIFNIIENKPNFTIFLLTLNSHNRFAKNGFLNKIYKKSKIFEINVLKIIREYLY